MPISHLETHPVPTEVHHLRTSSEPTWGRGRNLCQNGYRVLSSDSPTGPLCPQWWLSRSLMCCLLVPYGPQFRMKAPKSTLTGSYPDRAAKFQRRLLRDFALSPPSGWAGLPSQHGQPHSPPSSRSISEQTSRSSKLEMLLLPIRSQLSSPLLKDASPEVLDPPGQARSLCIIPSWHQSLESGIRCAIISIQ